MIQIRTGVFETNSSSTHSICIPKKTKITVNEIYFRLGEYGWENDKVDDAASYLYTAILDGYSYDEAMEKIEKLTDILNKHDIAYKFEKPEWRYDEYGDVMRLHYESGYVDHAYETRGFVEALLDDEDMLLRYLSEGIIYTGNDNQEDDPSGCNIANEYVWTYDDNWNGKEIPNPYHDEEKYDYFYKGN